MLRKLKIENIKHKKTSTSTPFSTIFWHLDKQGMAARSSISKHRLARGRLTRLISGVQPTGIRRATAQLRTKELNALLGLIDMSMVWDLYLRHRTRCNKVKVRCTLFHVITYAIHVEKTLTHVTRISLTSRKYLQYETSQFIDSTCTCMHRWFIYIRHGHIRLTNETGPLPLCTFSVMGLSMCSSIFSESSPLRSKSGIINELSGFPNSVPTVRCSVTSSNWHGHTGHAYCICFVGKH